VDKEQRLINVQKQFANLNAYKTYEQFILEEQQTQPNKQDQAVVDSYATELDAYEGLGVQKGYGPCK